MGDVIGFPGAAGPSRKPAAREPLWREVVGRQLREQRTRSGRTLADVATQAGVSTQYLSEIERGRKEPSSEVLAAVAEAVGLRLVDLTGRVTESLSFPSTTPQGGPTSPVCLAAV